MEQEMYLCIDLKSFYASVECVERGLDPMTTNLVVADPERGDRTICLAILLFCTLDDAPRVRLNDGVSARIKRSYANYLRLFVQFN